MKQVLIALLISLALSSCSTSRQIKKCENCFTKFVDTATIIKDSISITFDTVTHVIEVPADTSIQIIQIVCDSSGNASIKTSTTNNGNRSILTSSIKDNTLTIQAACLAYLDSIKTLNTTINKFKSEQSTVFVPKLVEAKLSWWQKFKINYGGYAIIGWIILILFFIGRKFLKAWIKANVPFTGKFF